MHSFSLFFRYRFRCGLGHCLFNGPLQGDKTGSLVVGLGSVLVTLDDEQVGEVGMEFWWDPTTVLWVHLQFSFGVDYLRLTFILHARPDCRYLYSHFDRLGPVTC